MQKPIFVSYHYQENFFKNNSIPVYASRVVMGDCTTLSGFKKIEGELKDEKNTDVVILFIKELEYK